MGFLKNNVSRKKHQSPEAKRKRQEGIPPSRKKSNPIRKDKDGKIIPPEGEKPC